MNLNPFKKKKAEADPKQLRDLTALFKDRQTFEATDEEL